MLVLSTVWPVAPTIAMSCAESCSRSRSSASDCAEPGVSPRRSAARRVLVATSLTIASSVPLPRFRPASSALST
jgi:hypothetical protein